MYVVAFLYCGCVRVAVAIYDLGVVRLDSILAVCMRNVGP